MNLSDMKKNWPSAIVARQSVHEFTGGLIKPDYMANIDNSGRGPDRIRIGRKIAYKVDDLIKWLEARTEVV